MSSFLIPAQALEAVGVYGGMNIADFGSGSGFFTRAAARAVGPEGSVWAVDIEQGLLDRVHALGLAEGLTNIELMQGDVSAHEGSHLPSARFDLVILANILFMLEEKKGALVEARRVLRPGGRALLIDWSSSHGGLGPHPEHVVTAKQIEALCDEVGLEVLDEVPAGAYHWGLIARA